MSLTVSELDQEAESRQGMRVTYYGYRYYNPLTGR
jgi:hypothetical protein